MTHAKLEKILGKTSRQTLGLMSGTSGDGLDITACVVGSDTGFLGTLASETVPYPPRLREKVLQIAQSGAIELHELISLSQYLGHFYADAIEQFCSKQKITLADIDLIGVHGQTVAHLAKPNQFLDRMVTGTLQIGEAEVIAKRFGIVTVSDFRSGDIAVGGSGAPLVPIYHKCVFAHEGVDYLVVNIGGIANITVLNGIESCTATDTGPGNCLIDTIVNERTGRKYDENGQLASAGTIDESLLNKLLSAEVFQRQLPASHDRGEIVRLLQDEDISRALAKLSLESALATLGELTAIRIRRAYEQLSGSTVPNIVYVCGGGAHNGFLKARLKQHFPGSMIVRTGAMGKDEDFVEAEAFAFLANLTLDDLAGNMPQVTGANRAAVIGKISLP